MKKILSLLFVSCFFFVGCATTSLSNLQRRSIEAKELEGNFDDAFKATMAVLQDEGYVIKHTDYKAGVIQAEAGVKQGMFADTNYVVTANLEQFGENIVKARITFMEMADYGDFGHGSKIIEDPKFLQKIYDNIQKEIFIRKNLAK